MPASLEIRMTADKGRGLFAAAPIRRGDLIVEMAGQVYSTDDMPEDGLAMQIGEDLWLVSPGESIDDCSNHSCDPNAGFLGGSPALFALRDIAVNEEICWDYSTSIAEPTWSLECRCGAMNCRRLIRSWLDLSPDERDRLRPIALTYLRSFSI